MAATLLLRQPDLPKDADFVASHLTPQALDTLAAETEMQPSEAIEWAARRAAPTSWTIVAQYGAFETPLGVIGIKRMLVDGDAKRIGQIWCVATASAEKNHGVAFSHAAKRWIDQQMKGYDVLYTIEDARNDVHLKWLRFCGFEATREVVYGPKNAKFLEMVRWRT